MSAISLSRVDYVQVGVTSFRCLHVIRYNPDEEKRSKKSVNKSGNAGNDRVRNL